MQASITRDMKFAHSVGVPVLTAIAAFYLLLVVAPFFLLGVHQQPTNLIIGGMFDPKGLAPYSTLSSDPGYWLYVLTMLTMIATPIVVVIIAPLVGLYLKRHWQRISAAQRTLALAIFTGSIALVLFFFTSPLNRLILTWWLD
jgi:hypothetical protein